MDLQNTSRKKEDMGERASCPDTAHLMPQHLDLEWSARVPRMRRPKNYLSRVASVLAWMICVVVALGVYTNVLADDTALRTRADVLARQQAGCGDQCHVTHMQGRRSVFGYRADYDIDGVGTVHVTCQRKEIVFGDNECLATR
jgi:hypothetical protein